MGLGEKHVLYRPNPKMGNSSIIYKVGHYTGALDVVFFRTCQSFMAPLLLGATDLRSPGALDASLLACFRCARPEARPLSFSRASSRSLNHPNITPRSTLQPHAVSRLSANAAGDMAKERKKYRVKEKQGEMTECYRWHIGYIAVSSSPPYQQRARYAVRILKYNGYFVNIVYE